MKDKHLLGTNLPITYLIKPHCHTDKRSLRNIIARSLMARKEKRQNVKRNLILLPDVPTPLHKRNCGGKKWTQDGKEARDLIICGENISLWLKPMLSRLTVIIDGLYL